MTLPLRGPYSLSCNDVPDLPELYDAYGKMIGHRYVLHDRGGPSIDSRFTNISVLDACATRFQGCASRFDMSSNEQGLDLVIISFALSGQILCYRQQGMECIATAGSAILHPTTMPLHACADRTGDVMAVALPRAKLAPLIADQDAIGLRVLPAQSAALSLFAGHARSFLALGSVPDPRLAQLVGNQLCDLAAFALGPSSAGKDTLMHSDALSDARHDRAMRYIARHLSEPGLGEKDLARHLGLSPSSVRQIFARKQTTVARSIRKARLEMAVTLLLGRGQHHRKVVSVAFDCGFRSMSAFYEAFRDQYDMHPSDLRASAPPHPMD